MERAWNHRGACAALPDVPTHSRDTFGSQAPLGGAVGTNEMVERVQSAPSAQQAANACVERAINGGSTDNITVVVVRVPKHATFEDPPDGLTIEEEWEEESTILF